MSPLRSNTATVCVLHTLKISLFPAGWNLDMRDWRNINGTTWTSIFALQAQKTSGKNTSLFKGETKHFLESVFFSVNSVVQCSLVADCLDLGLNSYI